MNMPKFLYRFLWLKTLWQLAFGLFAWAAAQSICAQEHRVVYDLSPGNKIIIKDATFKKASSALEETQISAFQPIVAFLKERPNLSVEIDGHADNQGDIAKNLALSLARAEAVRTFLLQNGIAASRIRTQGYGAQFPIASNDTEEGRSLNRRVEIIGLSVLTRRPLTTPDGKPLEPDGVITALKPQVNVLSAWQTGWQAAQLSQPIYEAVKINTMHGSRSEITFTNNSKLYVSENALVTVFGLEAAKEFSNTAASGGKSDGASQTEHVELQRGGLLLKLKELRKEQAHNGFSVRTKSAALRFGEGEAKIGVDEQARALVSVHQGSANVKFLQNDQLTGKEATISENFGMRIAENDQSGQVYALPPAPELLQPREREALSQEPLRFRWDNKNCRTRLEIAHSAEFVDVVYSAMKDNGVADVRLPEGTYIVRLTNIDSIGLESQSAIQGLIISNEAVSTRPKPFRFRLVEFLLLVSAGCCAWVSVLLKNMPLRFIAGGLLILALVLFAVL